MQEVNARRCCAVRRENDRRRIFTRERIVACRLGGAARPRAAEHAVPERCLPPVDALCRAARSREAEGGRDVRSSGSVRRVTKKEPREMKRGPILSISSRNGAKCRHLFRASVAVPFLFFFVASGLLGCTSETPAGTGQIPDNEARTAQINKPPIQDYRLAPGDVLEFRVLAGADTSDMDTVQQVRADGRITLPMIDDLNVSGMTLQQARSTLQKQYVDHGYLTKNAARGISLIIKESAANRLYVGGQVKKAGAFVYSHPTTVTRSIFEAGGMQDTADPTRVVVIRQDGSYQVVNVKKILAGNFQDDLQLRPMDTVYVPTSTIGDIDTFVQLYIKNVLPISPGIAIGF
jgi:protein involved in polysaccharide export with SLBB domain